MFKFTLILPNGNTFEMVADEGTYAPTVAYCENLYYKSRIQTFFIDGNEWLEPTD